MKYTAVIALFLSGSQATKLNFIDQDEKLIQTKEYPQPDIRGPMPQNAHPDSTFSSHVHNDWTYLQNSEYPQPDIRGPMPQNAHPDSTFSSHVHNDWTYLQNSEYPQPDIRGPMPQNAHPDSTFSSHVHNDWTYLQNSEYPQPDIRGPMPQNAHPDSTFSSHVHNDWTYAQQNDSDSSDSDSEDSEEDVQLEGVELVPVWEHDYKRVVPERFTLERDDRLMNSLISNYAVELRKDGKNTGLFYLDKEGAFDAAEEIVATHYKLDDKKSVLKTKFNKVWNHFDVNTDGLLEVERAPQFFRYLLGDSLEIGLQ